MRTAAAALDHLVLATPDLLATASWVEEATGVAASPGGHHLGLGTRNMLCSLGPTSYVEIIGPDLAREPQHGRRPYGIDDLRGPSMLAWAIAVPDIEAAVASARAAGYDVGRYTTMERRRPDGLLLKWQLTAPASPTIPFLIDWGESPHPAADSAPGLVLHDFEAQHPDPSHLAVVLEAVGVTMAIQAGPERLIMSLRGRRGSLDFS